MLLRDRHINDFANNILGFPKVEPLPDYTKHPDWHYPMSPHANPELFPMPTVEVEPKNSYKDVQGLNLSPNGIALIHHFESLRLKAYDDATGRTSVSRLFPLRGTPTIGWGTTVYPDGSPVKMGDEITEDFANEIFVIQLPTYENMVKRLVSRRLLQQEFDGLTSFCYNAGTGYISKSTRKHVLYNLWKHVNSHKDAEFMQKYWHDLAVTSGGRKMAGLVRRRKSEAHLFATGNINFFNGMK